MGGNLLALLFCNWLYLGGYGGGGDMGGYGGGGYGGDGGYGNYFFIKLLFLFDRRWIRRWW